MNKKSKDLEPTRYHQIPWDAKILNLQGLAANLPSELRTPLSSCQWLAPELVTPLTLPQDAPSGNGK
jgi:hypothetical protein